MRTSRYRLGAALLATPLPSPTAVDEAGRETMEPSCPGGEREQLDERERPARLGLFAAPPRVKPGKEGSSRARLMRTSFGVAAAAGVDGGAAAGGTGAEAAEGVDGALPNVGAPVRSHMSVSPTRRALAGKVRAVLVGHAPDMPPTHVHDRVD